MMNLELQGRTNFCHKKCFVTKHWYHDDRHVIRVTESTLWRISCGSSQSWWMGCPVGQLQLVTKFYHHKKSILWQKKFDIYSTLFYHWWVSCPFTTMKFVTKNIIVKSNVNALIQLIVPTMTMNSSWNHMEKASIESLDATISHYIVVLLAFTRNVHTFFHQHTIHVQMKFPCIHTHL